MEDFNKEVRRETFEEIAKRAHEKMNQIRMQQLDDPIDKLNESLRQKGLGCMVSEKRYV